MNKQSKVSKLTNEQLLEAYKYMLLFRRFEEKCGQLYGMGMIGGFCHLYIGQEAALTGVLLAKQKHDSLITSYRDHAHILGVGTSPREVLAELMGKATGCSHGKGGSMHMFDVQNRFYGGHGIVGAQVPLGTGIAFAEKYKQMHGMDIYSNRQEAPEVGISYTFFGDGAVNQGQVYEAFNLAALWNLPVIYVIENNEYAMGTAVSRSTAMSELYKKGISFGIDGIVVDGMDVEAVYECVSFVSEHVRKNSVPYIIEMKTYRYRGHSMSDPAKYRTKEEVDQYKQNDPLVSVKEKLLQFMSSDDLQSIEKEIKEVIQDAVDFATNSPDPDTATLMKDVFI